MPTVSVIVPNYNHAPYLRLRLDSIFNQTYQDFEVIILDDCSTDNSKEIIEEYHDRPQVSHIIYNEANGGSPFKQWAKGFGLAQGKYIWIAESDDWAESSFLKEMVNILNTKENLSLAFSASTISSNPQLELKAYESSLEIQGIQFIKSKMIISNGIPNASAVLFKKTLLNLIPTDYQNFRGAGDCLFWIYLCECGNIYYLSTPLNHFRIHSNNTTQKCQNDGTVCKEAFKIFQYLKKKKYISYWEDNLIRLKNIERIKDLKKSNSFSKDVNTKMLLDIWKNGASCISLKIKLIRFFALVHKFLYKFKLSNNSQNLFFSYFEKESFLTIMWKTFSLPSIGIHQKAINLKEITIKYIKQLLSYIKRPLNIFDTWAWKGRLNWMPDKWYLSLKYRSIMGYWINWKNPKSFTEKIQWLKIYDRNPLYTKLVDKYEVRKYIAERIGNDYLIPLLGVWERIDDIDLEKLPKQFVLKCTHDSGSIIICKDKATFDFSSAKKKLDKHLSINYYYPSREWPYKNIKPRIIAEQYIEEDNKELHDYKFFCFNGNVKYVQVDYDRFTEHHRNLYDINWKQQPFSIKYPSKQGHKINIPPNFEQMVNIARTLSYGFSHVRVDLYNISGKVFFGELTFFHGAGFEKISPIEWDMKIGSFLNIHKS